MSWGSASVVNDGWANWVLDQDAGNVESDCDLVHPDGIHSLVDLKGMARRARQCCGVHTLEQQSIRTKRAPHGGRRHSL